MMLHIALIFLVLIHSVIGDGSVAEDTLVFAHAIVRHGDRTPDPPMRFPSDLDNFDYYPFGTGELTKIGRMKSYTVGKELKKRYETFLGPKYYPEIVEATSSAFSRCRMTMQILLAAMFPPDSSQTFEEGLPWQPIGYKYKETMADPIIGTFASCQQSFNSDPVDSKRNVTLCEDMKWMYEYLTIHSGMKVNTLKLVQLIQDNLRSRLENGLELPTWAESIFPEPLTTCAYDFWRFFLDDQTDLAKAGGNFMKKLVDDSKEKIKGNPIMSRRKIAIYTIHDFNMFVLLKMLNNYNNIILNYLVHLLFEVHKINDVYGFKIFRENYDGLGLKLLEIPGCGSFCSLDEFYDVMKIYFNPEPC